MQTMDQSALIQHDKDIEQAAFALKAMSHPLRLKIMCILGSSELSVQEIVEQVGTTQSNISQHLAILREKEVLRTRKDANRVFYRIADPRTLQLMELLREVFCSDRK
ncbi:ArsR family transcriptional regulator [Novimethylophilus kurashikiensis]|uniref:ArsR family transcriptional regulator n=1 Tax=Novimethylophilus kurashikiensis TaxID=1825523 RepID=A0A2R5FH38_9PROT|nr:metalloregulator ArsR/SmtB family transcription factor [Novimethylophilus kurashikiensis]GBG15434.1 ArsR family transcriptional regulator [Novimethylophilus kurashikiensis]